MVHCNWRLLKQVFLFLITFLFAFLDKKKKLKFFFHLGGIFEGNYTPRGLHCFSSVMVRAPSLSLITYMLRYTGNFVENYYFLVNRLCYQFWRKTHFVITLYTDMDILILLNLQIIHCVRGATITVNVHVMKVLYSVYLHNLYYSDKYILHYVSTSHC